MASLIRKFGTAFGRAPEWIARAPGRVNLIGEHTDYNDGYVLPMAIERETRILAAGRDDGRVRLRAENLDRQTEFELDTARPDAAEPWSNYLRGVAAGLAEAGFRLRGADLLVEGDVPIGAGLSSSASLEMAAVQAFAAVAGFEVERVQAARIGQLAEHRFAGTRSGLMDQLASALGQPAHALLIDCRSLSFRTVALPDGAAVLIADTAVRRELAGSAYNERRAQCEAAAAALGIQSLRDATPAAVRSAGLPDLLERRAMHVVTENERVLQMEQALLAGDLRLAGELMDRSHVSLRDLYEVSSAELDTMAELLRLQPGCHGARLTGAGFGGCAVALLEAEAVEAVVAAVEPRYRQLTGLVPALYPTRAAAGARVERPD